MEPSEENEKKFERESEELLMDTPKRGRVATPLSKFEDSPVFNYICNLSPLETGRPLRISQSFNSYSFSSVPSIFTSPHVSSLKETKLLRRHSVSGSTNQEFSSENRNKICTNGGFVDLAQKTEEKKESYDLGGCVDNSFNKKKLESEVRRNQNYYNMGTCHGINQKCVSSELGGSSNSIVPFEQEGQISDFLNNREQSREDGSFDWVNISDAADFLILESPDNANLFKGSFVEPLDSEIRLNIFEETQADESVGVEINESENLLSQTSEDQLNAIEATGDVLAFTCIGNEATFLNSQATYPNNQANDVSNEVNANEPACNLPRGVRRRCLVFDGGTRRKFSDDGSVSSSFSLSKCHVTSNENQQIISKLDNSSSQCIVPGIGLHLNALARTSNDYTANNHDTVATQRLLINDLSSNVVPDLFANNIENINHSVTLNSVNRDEVPVDGGFRGTEDGYEVSGYIGDDLNQGSPKNKKRKLENGEPESCKRCNCKKSKCLKLYCECFAAGVYCVEPCSCQDCFNKPIHEDTVLATRKQIESRNPLAFAPKVIRATDFVPETMDDLSSTPASARHKRGCNCKKSGCLKKYCECYQGGVGCSINCRCEGCKNVFGRKEGSHIVLAEAETEEKEMHQKNVADKNSTKQSIQINTGQTQESSLPETPMHSGRAPHQHPLSSKNKPRRTFLSTGSSSSTLYGGQKYGTSAFLQSQLNYEKRVSTNMENEDIPEILRSPVSGIKSSSPNSKRVSPPHCDFGSSSSPTRISRKLILRSIPSFPSLKD